MKILHNYTYYVSTIIGFSYEIDNQLLNTCTADIKKERNKQVCLVLDEVHIKKDLVYDKHQGTLIGFANLGAIVKTLPPGRRCRDQLF